MQDINILVRKNILSMLPYSSARDEYTGKKGIFLDANENPFGKYNRYPDPKQQLVKNALANLKQIAEENIFLGNGSDEVIDLLCRIFCEPGKDKALTFSPTYGMYKVAAAINDITLLEIPLNESFQIDFDAAEKIIASESPKLLFICSPNNPTGNSLLNIERLIKSFKGIVVIDEAYIDFSLQKSFIDVALALPNVVVMQTLSKAWGLAAARVGMAFANPALIALFNRVKPPYNISLLNQQAAVEALQAIETFETNKATILNERKRLEILLESLPSVIKVYPSDANFILVAFNDADAVYHYLVQKEIITRNRHSVVKNAIRITVGSSLQNDALVKALSNFQLQAQ